MDSLQVFAIMALLAIVGVSNGAYTVYPSEYDLTDKQFEAITACIAVTNDKTSPQSRYDPVCATDGFSYYNLHTLECLRQAIPSVQFSFYGRCPNEPIFLPMESVRDWWVMSEEVRKKAQTCMSKCGWIFMPVCGTDNKTYTSHCVLECVSELIPHIKKDYDGFCRKDFTVENKCPPILQPFCGTDGVTYLNLCHLRYATEQIPGLYPAHLGDCVRRLNVIEKGFDMTSKLKDDKDGCSGCGGCCET
ncbi:serine protease inhibitor dipetalogastin-like [Malaya genurostris]|uniref:serine protease inhibitor dipetalogastin-like n=1 Tax=Malaya genurostris TaxID=325434 RepID=UPI0026F3F7C7|nr:serine protease inhibitor dipetalogastin-like [Malaya genurostris]